VGGPVLLVFTLTALALVGLAWVLGQATESVGHYAGPQIGDILNATFGNAEFIITVFALSAGLTRVVKHRSSARSTTWTSRWRLFGSSLQIPLLVPPILVILGPLLGPPLDLVFTPLELVSLGAAVVVTAFIALDGKSNRLEGAMLCGVYIIAALAFFSP
jgi:Ca2+/H+ antiporter